PAAMALRDGRAARRRPAAGRQYTGRAAAHRRGDRRPARHGAGRAGGADGGQCAGGAPPAAGAGGGRFMTPLAGLAPVFDPVATRLLVLGSFPGVASLRAQQYYGHPQNQFWKILGVLWQQDLMALPYPQRLDVVRTRGLGIWDVYAACEREGSL